MSDPLLQSPIPHPAGSRLGPYTIERQIGEGGMALLYLAVDENGAQHVLKLPRAPAETDPASQVAFENEVRLAPYLGDFARVSQSRTGESDGERYLVLTYIDGTDLWTHLRANGCLGEREAVVLAKKIVSALAELHERRILHLDVKLSNIMLTPSGDVRVIDFGLANHLDLPDLILESFHEPKGTPAYIAPEQFLGVRDEPRSDIFSIGTLLFEMTTSRLPFLEAHSELDVINRIKREPVSPRVYRPELSSGFESIIMTCLETVPDRRYASMRELHAALEKLEQTLDQRAAALAPEALGRPAVPGRVVALASRLMRRSTDLRVDRLEGLKRWVAAHRGRRPAAPYRIVVALDSASGARIEAINRALLDATLRLARMQPSMITVLTVLAPQDTGMADGAREAQIINASYHSARNRINRLLPPSGSMSAPIGINVRTGNDVEAISTCVADYGADLLVIGARERNALSRFLLGSTTYKVLTTLSCPVFVVRERRKPAKPKVAEPMQAAELSGESAQSPSP